MHMITINIIGKTVNHACNFQPRKYYLTKEATWIDSTDGQFFIEKDFQEIDLPDLREQNSGLISHINYYT